MSDKKDEKKLEGTLAYLGELRTELNTIADKKNVASAEMAKVFGEFKGKDIPADKLEQLEKIREDIVKCNDEYSAKNEEYQLLQPLETINERKSAESSIVPNGSNYDKNELKSFFDNAVNEIKGRAASGQKNSIGKMVADILTANEVKSVDRFEPNAYFKLNVFWGGDKPAEGTADKDVKSLYSGNNAVVLGAGAVPIAGQQGYCGVMDDLSYCPFIIPEDDFENCITQGTLTAPKLRYQRINDVDANAASVPETIYTSYGRTPVVAQDGLKPESSFDLEWAELVASKIAHYVVASDEVIEDCNNVTDMINNFLMVYLEKEKRRQLIAGNPAVTATDMRGILFQPDILSRTHRVTGTALLDDNIYDTFRRAMTDLYYQGADTSNLCVIMNPRDLEIIDLQKDDEGRYLFNDETCMNRQLRCFSISTSVDMPQGQAVIGDMPNNWMFYVRKPIEMKMGLTGYQFIENTMTFLAEMRGLTFLRCPQRVIRITGLAA